MNNMWRYSRGPLAQPLLRRLLNKEELAHQACVIFQAIQLYMGDMPGRHTRLGLELTDLIFSGPLKQEILRDEVYCQIMKQLTDNPGPGSEQQGWQLLWLATGLFSCSQTLLKDLTHFLFTRRHPIAADCLKKLKKTCQRGQRKSPPHRIEVEAIQHHTTQIFHKVYFPDDTNEAFTVKSSTQGKELCQAIANRLRMKSAEGFSLFVKIGERVVSMPEGDFFFDFIRSINDLIRKGKVLHDASPTSPAYQVFFMRKLWSSSVPGKDRKADIIFHFHQELPKLLRGYHQCSKEEAAILGALVYRANHAESRTDVTSVIKSILPCDLVKIQSSYEWKKDIIRAYNKDSGMSPDEAKVAFLKVIYRWPTYGSAFFEVNQVSDQSFPDKMLVAVNKQGLSIIHMQSKELLASIPFSHIMHWASGPTHFNITVGDSASASKLMMETSLAYKMDDLLTSYIALVIASQESVNTQ
jgi:myosin-7